MKLPRTVIERQADVFLSHRWYKRNVYQLRDNDINGMVLVKNEWLLVSYRLEGDYWYVCDQRTRRR